MKDVKHITYYSTGITRTFCTKCSWSVASKHRSLNLQAFEKHVCKRKRQEQATP